MTSERLLEAREVAQILSVKESWVRAETRAGRIPHVPLGRYIRYREHTVRRFIDERERAEWGR